MPPGLDETRQAFKLFEDEFEKLTETASPGHMTAFSLAIPGIGDIVKVFDSIMKAIEWFKKRNDDQRKQAADIIHATAWRQWTHVGDPDPGSKPKESSATTVKKKSASTGT